MGIRGEPSTPPTRRTGQVWSAILGADRLVGLREQLCQCSRHRTRRPFTGTRGALAAAAQRAEGTSRRRGEVTLGELVATIGCRRVSQARTTPILVGTATSSIDSGYQPRIRCSRGRRRGPRLALSEPRALFPYGTRHWLPVAISECARGSQSALAVRTNLWSERELGADHREARLAHGGSGIRFLATTSPGTPLSIAFAFVATHNHFVLDRGGKVFNHTAPVIKLPPSRRRTTTCLLGLLNSSTACFWMKQVCHRKGQHWRYQARRNGTSLERHLVRVHWHRSSRVSCASVGEPVKLVRSMSCQSARNAQDSLRSSRLAQRAASLTLKYAVEARRARLESTRSRSDGALQEELDWESIRLFGLAPVLQTLRIVGAAVARLGRAAVRDRHGAEDGRPESWSHRSGSSATVRGRSPSSRPLAGRLQAPGRDGGSS